MFNRVTTGMFQTVIPRISGAAVLILVTVLLLGSCAEEPSSRLVSNQSGGLTTTFTPPEMLTQPRAPVDSSLRLSIVVNGVEYAPNIEPGVEQRSPTIPIARGQQLDIVVTWSEMYNGVDLILAQAIVTDQRVPEDGDETFEVRIETDKYTTGFDYDGDRISNLRERIDDTDPLVAEVLAEPIKDVTIQFTANTPERLTDLSNANGDTLSAFAKVNNSATTIRLIQEGDAWVNQTTSPANSDVRIEYLFNSTLRPLVTLATWDDTRNVGENGITVVAASEDYSYNFDSDTDGLDNATEFVNGSNPEDSSSPRVDPCDISNFEPGCNFDSDDDGTPDSVETETADQDEDGIPDYLESKNDDADEDGANAEEDRDEGNPCIPDEDAIACDDTDTVTDPPTDPPIVIPPDMEPPAPSPLSYEYYEGQFESMPNFDALTPVRTGTAETFSLPPSEGVDLYALRFTGTLYVAQTDDFIFYSESNDGSRLYIDGNLIVNNDGVHNLIEVSGTTALAAGEHSIVLEYFQNRGTEGLTVSWSSSNIAKQPIPASVLFAP